MQCLSSTISLLFMFLVFCFLSHVSGKLLSEKMILLEFKSSVSDPYGLLYSWKASSSNYCSWVGVTCNSNSKVSGLNITGGNSSRVSFCSKYKSVYSLHEFGIRRNCSDRKGKLGGILSPVIGKLSELRVLSLPFNELKGEIPREIWGLKKLEILDLEGNLISGKFPGEFLGLRKLRVLNLGFNEIVGEISGSLSKCRNLEVLNLSSNRISGHIDGKLGDLKSLSVVDLSHNKLDLDCQLPFNLSGMKNLKYLSLDGNSISGTIRDRFLESTPAVTLQKGSQNYVGNQSENDSKSAKKGLNAIQITTIASGTAVVAVLLTLFALLFYVRKWKTNSRVVQVSASPDRTDRKEIVVFNDIGVPLTLEKVVNATGDFNSTSCIGNGGFGSTYRAEISPGTLVAVKKLTLERCQGIPQFEAEIRSLKRVRHPNLITLIGYYASKSEMFLIYNYLPGGNLEQFIQERVKRAVDWRVLHKIALDIASAIDYLHNQCNPRVLHRDIKPSNILLDEELNAYLSDFGVSRLLGDTESHVTTGVTGTFGYVAPEYALTCRVTEKADVYSYGVVLLELISDKRSLDPSFSSHANGFTIVSWAFMLMRSGQAKEVLSADLWAAGPQDILLEILDLASMCTVESLSDRPTMKQVVRRLKQLQPPSC